MIGTLNKYFGTVPAFCTKDPDATVHYNGERVALNNSTPNGYIYLSGEIEFEAENTCIGEYKTRQPLVFVGAYPNAIAQQLINATVSAMAVSNVQIRKVTIDKSAIANAEKIDLSKFKDVALIRVYFELDQYEIYDNNCNFDPCKC